MTKTELLKIAKPILFNTDMVRAILAGRKTVTRRVVNFPNNEDDRDTPVKIDLRNDGLYQFYLEGAKAPLWRLSPKYRKGDILYVRETWCEDVRLPYDNFVYKANMPQQCNGSDCPSSVKRMICSRCENVDGTLKWRPSIHMPKEAARIFLRVTGVRVERLQDITVDECCREGCCSSDCYGIGKHSPDCKCDTRFTNTWNSTIKPADLPLYGWNANPFVWVYEFERIEVE